MTVVIHINDFSGKIAGGYLMSNGRKVGEMMTAVEVLSYLTDHLDARCDFLRV